MKLLEYYLDISKAEQKRRLRDRKTDPLKQRNVSPIDDQAINAADLGSAIGNEPLANEQF